LNQRCILQRWYTYKSEYLCEFETEFENILRCESGAHMGSIIEKIQRSMISCYCTLKVISNFFSLTFAPHITATNQKSEQQHAKFQFFVVSNQSGDGFLWVRTWYQLSAFKLESTLQHSPHFSHTGLREGLFRTKLFSFSPGFQKSPSITNCTKFGVSTIGCSYFLSWQCIM
jgi:hypothetical protein